MHVRLVEQRRCNDNGTFVEILNATPTETVVRYCNSPAEISVMFVCMVSLQN